MPEVKLKNMLDWQHFLFAHIQFFKFLERDVKIIQDGKSIVYGIDGYDTNTLTFPKEVLSVREDSHYELTKGTWLEFLKNTKNDETFQVVITPLSIFDILTYINVHAKDCLQPRDFEILREIRLEELIQQMSIHVKKEIDPRSVPWSKLDRPLKNAWDGMSRALSLSKSQREEGFLHPLFELIASKRVDYLSNFLSSLNISCPSDIFLQVSQNVSPRQGISYLDMKRGSDEWQHVHNLVDISNLIAFDRLSDLFKKKGVVPFITSHGQLTLNAWAYCWISDKKLWPARPSAVPCYLSVAKKKFHSDYNVMKERFEEAHCATRRLWRKVSQIPGVADCADPKKRAKMRRDLIVKLPKELPLEMLYWLKEFYNEYSPKVLDTQSITDVFSKEHKVNLEQLIEWIHSPEKRRQIYDIITQQTRKSVRKMDFLDFENFPFYGAIGEKYVEINHWLRTRR